MRQVIGYTAGSFDLFNVGDLDLLRAAKLECDHLIVGVYSDELAEARYGARPYVPRAARMEILKSVRGVDEVVPVASPDARAGWERLRFDVAFVNVRTDLPGVDLRRDLADTGVRVVELAELRRSASPVLQMALDRDLARTSVA